MKTNRMIWSGEIEWGQERREWETQKEKLRENDQYSQKLEDVFFGQKPISKISQGCKFHNVSDFVCSDEKEGDGKDKK